MARSVEVEFTDSPNCLQMPLYRRNIRIGTGLEGEVICVECGVTEIMDPRYMDAWVIDHHCDGSNRL